MSEMLPLETGASSACGSELREPGGDIRPGVELVPGEDERVTRRLVGPLQPEAGQDALEIAPVHDVEPCERLAAGAYLLHARLVFAAPGIGEGGPIEIEAFRCEDGARLRAPRRSASRPVCRTRRKTAPWVFPARSPSG